MRVLVVEDEPELAARVAAALDDAGFAVDIAADGERADHLARTEPYDAAVLDLGLPRRDGISLLRAWRERGITLPVLILTARGRWTEKEAGFGAGADDYLTKPFEMGEVVLRVKALVRRSHNVASPEIVCGALRLDTHSGRALLAGEVLDLTAQEWRLLGYLAHHSGQIVSRSELREHVWERDLDPDSNVIDVVVARLRRKIGRERIETLRGRGYRLVATGE